MIITVKKVQYRYVKDAYIKKLRYIITQFFVEFFPIYNYNKKSTRIRVDKPLHL